MRTIALDCETFRIGPGNVVPRMICVSVHGQSKTGKIESGLWGNHPDDGAEAMLAEVIGNPDLLIVTHNGAYDWAVIVRSYPALLPAVFQRLAAFRFEEDLIDGGYCTDTQYRELLLNLSTTGDLTKFRLPSGAYGEVKYTLADLETKYLGLDRKAEKQGTPEEMNESWRLNFGALDGWRAADYPEDAREYAMADAKGTYEVYLAQEERKAQAPKPQTVTEGFQTWSAFSLYLMTAWGMKTNRKNVLIMKEKVGAIIEANKSLLIEEGILIEGCGPSPRKHHLGKAIDILKQRFNSDSKLVERELELKGWGPFIEILSAKGVKFLQPKEDKIKQAPLQARAAAIYKQIGEIPNLTPTGEISLAEGVPEHLAQYDEVFAQYARRQELIKLRTQHIPLLESAAIVHPNYAVLKETGRTSSYGARKGRVALYPATNIQQVPAAEIEGIDVRQCYEPRPGTVFWDVDGTTQELACVGQITFNLFGHSVHLDTYNAGRDLHGYLAAQLVILIGGPGLPNEFVQECRKEGILGDPVAVYDTFMHCKHHTEEAVREELYKHWRTFAKPTGLGFPGMLGPETMVTYAKQTYGVKMTLKQAYEARDGWRATYPEMVEYKAWVEGQGDEWNSRETKLYQYTTPMGMLRRGASFCATANGMAMQSPAAECMKLANNNVVRECYDPTRESVLLGCRPIYFGHDQILGETIKDRSLWHDQCMRVKEIIIAAHAEVLPDIKFRCDEAHLTSVWSKKSEPKFGPDKRLIPWTPTK